MRQRPHAARRLPLLSRVLLAALLASSFTSPARAAEDDFDFAQTLAAIGQSTRDRAYFAYARRVLDAMLADPAASAEMKDLANYGIARLASDEARGALMRSDVPFKTVVDLYEKACSALEAFVAKYPNHARADEARLAVGSTRLGFAQFVRDGLMSDGEEMQKRGTSAAEVQSAARSFVDEATKHFDRLRKGYDGPKATDTQLMAHYHWVVCQHYRALVEQPCSSSAMHLLRAAAKHLEDFAFEYEGTLISMYAQDMAGLTFAEIARCATDQEERTKSYQAALAWFEPCMETPNESPEHLELIARGYYHYARTCNEIGEIGSNNYHRIGISAVSQMLTKVPDASRTDNGIRAWIELGRMHAARQSSNDAISVLDQAATFAAAAGQPALEYLANREIAKILDGATGPLRVGAEIMIRTGNARMSEERWAEAVTMFQQAVAGVARAPENAAKLTDLWRRISHCYTQMGDDLGSLFALDAIHELWQDGIIPRSGQPTDPNLIEYGNTRLGAANRWRSLAESTKSSVLEARFRAMRNSFPKDYVGHPQEQAGIWNEAAETLSAAQKATGAERTRHLKRAEELLRQVTKDATNQRQDAAWAVLARIRNLQEDPTGALKVRDEAVAAWETPEAKELAEAHDTVRARRHAARGELLYWVASTLIDAKRWNEVLQVLDGYHGTFSSWRSARPDTNDFIFYSGTLAFVVESHLGLNDVASAVESFQTLLRVAPNSARLPIITQKLAGHYNQEARSIEEKMRALMVEAGELKRKMTEANRNFLLKVGARNAAINAKETSERYVTSYDEIVAEGKDPLREGGRSRGDYDMHQQKIKDAEIDIARLSQEVTALRDEMDAVAKRTDENTAESRAVRGELYTPREKAAGFYYELWRAQKDSPSPVPTENLRLFADLYRRAALLRPDVDENWRRARELYEDVLTRADLKPEIRQDVMGELGGVYYRLAIATTDPKQRASLVELARERLQASMASHPANNPLLVSMLKGQLVAYNWASPDGAHKVWVLLPVVGTVADLKEAVRKIGTPEGAPQVTYARDADRNRHEQGLKAFQQHVLNVWKESDLRSFSASLPKAAGLNPLFWAEVAGTSRDFRLALAWVFVESGAAEDAPKAAQLADSLTRSGSRLAFTEEDEDWWLSTVLGLRARVLYAERVMAAEQASETAKALTNTASTYLAMLVNTRPQLGEPARPETLDELLELQSRIDALRSRAGMSRLDLRVERRDVVSVGVGDGAEAPAETPPSDDSAKEGE